MKQKPYIEEKDYDGRPDDELASEAWANYKARNNSYIVDHFQVGPGGALLGTASVAQELPLPAHSHHLLLPMHQGLYKSKLVCPRCGHTSVKFDPFMYLTLPLPNSDQRTMAVSEGPTPCFNLWALMGTLGGRIGRP